MYYSYLPYLILSVPIIVLIIIVVGIVVFFTNRNNKNNNNMDLNQTQGQVRPKASAKDIFLNLGAFVALCTLVGNLIGLLFTIIDKAYPRIINGYDYMGSSSISWPVATIVVFFPVFILLMWFLEKEYRAEPERQTSIVHRAFAYITLFITGLVIIGDLITVVYYFIDGQELTTGFLLKVLALLVICSGLFIYFISDLRGKLTSKSRMFWRGLAGVIIVISIVWGFAVLGSPRTQRLIKYDQQKVSDLQNINSQIESYYSSKGILPDTLKEMSNGNYYITQTDSQNGKPYEYAKTSDTTYNLCAEFNKASDDKNVNGNLTYPVSYPYGTTWTHPAGHYCFAETINLNTYNYPKGAPAPVPVNY